MARIPEFAAQAPRRGAVSGFVDTGAADVWSSLASASGRIADRLGRMADQQAAREGQEAGFAAAASVRMPGVDFAFKEGTPGTAGTPGRYTAASAGSTAPLTGDLVSRAAFAKKYLETRFGLKPHQSAAIVGHGIQESNLRPVGAVGDQGTAFGMFQWRGARYAGLKRFAASTGRSPDMVETQLDYVMHELRTSERSAGKALASAADVEQATAAFMGFERPQGWTPGNPRGGHAWSKRLKHARQLAGAGEALAPAPTAAAALSPAEGTIAGAPARFEPGTPGTAGTPPAIDVHLTPGDVAPKRMRPGTIRGDAFNAAVTGMHLDRLETAMSAQMDALAMQTPDDPAALSTALDALRGGYREGLEPREAAMIEGAFQRRKLGLVRSAATRWQQNFEDQRQAVFEDTLASRQDNALRIARIAGTDANADAALAAEMEAMDRQISGSALSEVQKGRLRRKIETDVLSTRIAGGFDNQPDAVSRARFAETFQREWQDGKGFGGKVDAESYDRITADMTRRIEADQVAADKRNRAIDKEITGQIGLLKKGFPVPDDRRQALRAAVATTDDPALAQNLDFLDGLANWQRAHIGARPQVVDAQIGALKTRMVQDGATPAALTTLDVMESLKSEMAKGLADDPVGWADRAGVARIEPLDFSSPEGMVKSLVERGNDAEAIGAHYGTEPKYFTPAEKTALARSLEDNPENLPVVAGALREAFGDKTPQALKEISKDAPVVAHVAGLYDATGSQTVALEVADALAWRKLDGYEKTLPPPAQLADVARTGLGAALAQMPDTQMAITQTAALLFEARARRQGLSIDDFDEPGSEAQDLYLKSLDDAAGGHSVGDVKMGGIVSVNGVKTIAPAMMMADAVEPLIWNLSQDDLATQAPIKSVNGVPIRPKDLRNGRLVAAGDGLYHMTLGDPSSYDPRYVLGADGQPWTLDLRALTDSQRERGVGAVDDGRSWSESLFDAQNPEQVAR
ncbi:phage tail tip lysozyme [Jiella avicenniae]|uniref:Phage tail tip lysozyme n=1 Tax=Jiella avicenniae TaxID=2907202 RepID=A0A9X1T9L1_9HYPH|nr:phage tail tip lysozyme [Jiella avicenniae]MCE7026428.1 phage tail tip lysozyme [Jiella avicenniae]